MLDTLHDREFYEAKAREHELLEQVITGQDTLQEMLLAMLDPDHSSCSTAECDYGPQEELDAYISALTDLSESTFSENLGENILFHRKGTRRDRAATYLSVTSGGGASLAVICMIVPPLIPLFIPLTVAGCAGGALICNKILYWSNRKHDKLVAHLYGAAEEVDLDISKCFIMEHFKSARPRFAQTYRSLSGDERKKIDAQLNSYLGAGGIRGMDEIQLKDYLSGLLVPQMEGDA